MDRDRNQDNNASGSGDGSAGYHQRHGLLPNPTGSTQESPQTSNPHEVTFIYPCRYCTEPQTSTSSHDFDEGAFENMAVDTSPSDPIPERTAQRSITVTADLPSRISTVPARYRCKRYSNVLQEPSPPNQEKKSKFE